MGSTRKNRYCRYLFGTENEVTDVKEIAADFDVRAVLIARAAATEAVYYRFELRHRERVVRREVCSSAA
jgi:hypothetical protein